MQMNRRNALAAFAAAVREGHGIELDVRLAADREAVVFHDDDLDRLTDGAGPVAARTAAASTVKASPGGGAG